MVGTWKDGKMVTGKPAILESLVMDSGRHLIGRRGIEPKAGLNPFLITALNVFCMHKNDFFSLNFFFFI